MRVLFHLLHCPLHQAAPLLVICMVEAQQPQPLPPALCIYELVLPEGRRAWIAATGGTPDADDNPPVYSFDNPSIHTDPGMLTSLGLADPSTGKPADKWLELPPRSGDLHRTIERVHARICGAFRDWLYDDCTEYCMMGYCLKLAQIFKTTQTAQVISKCMKNITALYRKVVELEGKRAPRPFR